MRLVLFSLNLSPNFDMLCYNLGNGRDRDYVAEGETIFILADRVIR